MKRKILILSIILILILLWAIYHHNHSSKANKLLIAVSAVPVEAKDQLAVTIQTIGNVEPFSTVAIKSRVDGQLLKVNFKPGDLVSTGQLLFNIDTAPYKVQLEQAQANYAQDAVQLTEAENNLKRYKQLLKKHYVSQQDYEQLQTQVKTLEAKIAADKAAIDTAKLLISYCTITSPVTGRAGDVLIDEGNLVKATDTSPLVIINQIKPIYVGFALPSEYLPQIQQAASKGSVTVNIEGQQIKEQGQLSFINNTVDTTTGTISFKATFANNQNQLWPGELVHVQLPLYTLTKALIIPTRAIQSGANGAYVFVVKNNHAYIQTISPGPVVGSNTVVNKGLTAKQKVVLQGQLRLVDGSPVKVISGKKAE